MRCLATLYLPHFVETACTLFNTMYDPGSLSLLVESLVSPSPILDPLDKMYSIALDSIYVHDQFEGDLGNFLDLQTGDRHSKYYLRSFSNQKESLDMTGRNVFDLFTHPLPAS